MKKQRRHKKSWFGRLLMNFVMSASVLVTFSLGIAACARKDVGTLASHQPRFVLEEFFTGQSVAYGIFEDRFGNLRRQFRVNLSGKLDGSRLVLYEEFLYDDGERASRTWTIDRLGSASDGTVLYNGRAADVKAAAQGLQVGNALNWRYDITLEMSGISLDVHFDDWIYKQDEDIAINRAFVNKFGVEIGSVTIVFIRGKTASSLWPLSLDEWPR
jgi:hypothetical protein